MANPVPEGFRTVTPHITVKNAAAAIEFYKRAFGAEEILCMKGPDGKSVMHAEIKIGDSIIMLNDEWPGGPGPKAPTSLNGTSGVVHLYVKDVDAAYKKAVDAGATPTMPVSDMFWGDRYGGVADPFGHQWSIATHKQDLTREQLEKNAKEFMAKMGAGGGCDQAN